MKKNEQVTDRKRARRQQNKEIKDKILKRKVVKVIKAGGRLDNLTGDNTDNRERHH